MMKSLVKTLKESKVFYSLCIALLIGVGLLLCLVTKAESFIAVNLVHNRLFDYLMALYTNLGDGIFSLLVCVVLLFTKQKKLAACILLAYTTSGCFAQFLKHMVFAPRPKVFFETSHISFYIDFFKTSHTGNNSFPSGHTTSAFALATVLASHFRKPIQAALLFLGALLVGYSRIYTGEHFPLDVYTGIWIGILFGLSSVLLFKYNTLSFPKFISNKYRGRQSQVNLAK
ncbi:membrane-associated phospholipid phosphatase [Pedobacter sp. UYP24]